MDYESMSDFEINKAVAEIRHEKVVGRCLEPWCQDPDYCNNPLYSWPIIVENKISVIAHRKNFSAYNFGQAFSYRDDTSLRAAMIVFLMMQEKPNV